MGDGGREENEVTDKQATRRQLQLRRARTSTRDTRIISEFERGCTYAAWALGAMWALVCAMWAVM